MNKVQYLIVFSLELTLTRLLGGGLPLDLRHSTGQTHSGRKMDACLLSLAKSHGRLEEENIYIRL